MAEKYKREIQQKFSEMTFNTSSENNNNNNNNNRYDDDKNIMLQGSKSSSSDKTTLIQHVENEASAASTCRHFKEMFDRANEVTNMTFEEEYEYILSVPPPPRSPIDYEADRVASLLLYEKMLKELYEDKSWPTGPDYSTREEWVMAHTMPAYMAADTGPNKGNKQSSFIPPSLSRTSKRRLSIGRKVKGGKHKKKSYGKQKNNVAILTRLRKTRY